MSTHTNVKNGLSKIPSICWLSIFGICSEGNLKRDDPGHLYEEHQDNDDDVHNDRPAVEGLGRANSSGCLVVMTQLVRCPGLPGGNEHS